MKILLVEDDFDLSGALVRVLVRRGFDVVCCGDGIDALNLTRHHNFAAILLDLSIPGIDGLRVLQRLRDADNATPSASTKAHGKPPPSRMTGCSWPPPSKWAICCGSSATA